MASGHGVMDVCPVKYGAAMGRAPLVNRPVVAICRRTEKSEANTWDQCRYQVAGTIKWLNSNPGRPGGNKLRMIRGQKGRGTTKKGATAFLSLAGWLCVIGLKRKNNVYLHPREVRQLQYLNPHLTRVARAAGTGEEGRRRARLTSFDGPLIQRSFRVFWLFVVSVSQSCSF